MKKMLIGILFLVISSVAFSYDYQNYSSIQVGPGIIHKKYVEPNVPWTLDVLEIDLTDTNNTITSVKADDKLIGRERLSKMSSRNNRQGHQVVGLINADFFSGNGTPINNHIVNGEFVKTENINVSNPVYWSSISFDFEDLPNIARPKFNGKLFTNSANDTIHDVNSERYTDELILYNHFFGNSTNTNKFGTEVLLNNLNKWYVNDTIFCVVESIEDTTGNMTIPSNKIVLSGHGVSSDFLKNNLTVGDTVKIFLGLESLPQKIETLVGGYPKIVKNGNNYAYQGFAEEGGSNNFATARHPRTGVGISADSSKIFFITVDGRQEISDGMNLSEFADFMVTLGIERGINLDGGGSTEMFVRGKIANSPSDGGERAVSNSLMTISTAPQDTLSIVQISPDNKKILVGSRFQFDISGWDKYYNPKAISKTDVEFSVDANLGTIEEDSLFIASENKNSGFVYVNYKNSIDSAYIYLKAIKTFNLFPTIAIADTINPLIFTVEIYDEYDLLTDLSNNNFNWISTNTTVGTINSDGEFMGHAAGTTEVIVNYLNLSDTTKITVQIGENTILDSLENANIFQISGENIDTIATTITAVDTPKTFGDKSLKLDYSFTRQNTKEAWVFLNRDIPIYNSPIAIYLDIKSDCENHRGKIIIRDAKNKKYFNYFNSSLRHNNFYSYYVEPRRFTGIGHTDKLTFPITIESIQIKLGNNTNNGELTEGTIYLDNLHLLYAATSIKNINLQEKPRQFRLKQNYPNPFNNTTTIEYYLPTKSAITIEVYNLLGKKIETLIKKVQFAGFHIVEYNADNLSSGIYFYVVKGFEEGNKSNHFSSVKKFILLK